MMLNLPVANQFHFGVVIKYIVPQRNEDHESSDRTGCSGVMGYFV